MSDEEYIRKAESVPYMFWNDITALIESAPEHLKERLRWIMREKDLLEQIDEGLIVEYLTNKGYKVEEAE